MSLPVVVLAGGLATRLRPLTERVPKILLDIAGRPFAEHQVELLGRHGLTDIVFCVGHLGEQVEAALGDGTRWGMRFRYLFDGPRLLGTGGALRRALPLVGPEFLVVYGDSYLECDYEAIEATFRASVSRGESSGLMTVYRNDNQFDRSNVEFRDGRIVRYDKVARTADMRHIDYGLGALTADAFAPWNDGTEPFDLSAVYQQLVAAGTLAGYEVTERFYEIGSAEGLEDTRALLAGRERTSR